MDKNESKTEWCLLQNQFDSYEKHSLYIKLTSIIVLLSAEIFAARSVVIVALLAVLWLQDAIWKTFQSRIEPRLLQLEVNISQQCDGSAFQFNREYQKVSLTGLSLMIEYLHQSIRPTVAFPHVVLLLILLFQYIIG